MILAWKGVVEGYTKNQATKFMRNFNKTALYELEDLMQEGYLLYMKVIEKYKEINEPKHLMSLYKSALKNRFSEVANELLELSKTVYIEQPTDDESENVFNKITSSVNTEFRTLLSTAPTEIKDLLFLIFDTPQEYLEILGLNKKRRRGFQNNPLVCKLLGYNSAKVNLVKNFKEYFET